MHSRFPISIYNPIEQYSWEKDITWFNIKPNIDSTNSSSSYPFTELSLPNYHLKMFSSKIDWSKNIIWNSNNHQIIDSHVISDIETIKNQKERMIISSIYDKEGKDLKQSGNNISSTPSQQYLENISHSPIYHHSNCVLDLPLQFYPNLLNSDLLHHYHHPLIKLPKISVSSIFPTLPADRYKGKVPQSFDNLSNESGDIILVEYLEQSPHILPHVGMCSLFSVFLDSALIEKDRNQDKDFENQLLDYEKYSHIFIQYESITPSHTLFSTFSSSSPFFIFQNNLFLSLAGQFIVPETDFLLVHSTDSTLSSWYVTEIQHYICVGQQIPKVVIPRPFSEQSKDYKINKIKHFVYHHLLNNSTISVSHVFDTFPEDSSLSETFIRKIFQNLNLVNISKGYSPSTPSSLLDLYSLRNFYTPEDYCLFLSLQYYQLYLEEKGYLRMKPYPQLTTSLLDRIDYQIYRYIQYHLHYSPWNVSYNINEYLKNGDSLKYSGEGNPLGEGQGFDFASENKEKEGKTHKMLFSSFLTSIHSANQINNSSFSSPSIIDLRKLKTSECIQELVNTFHFTHNQIKEIDAEFREGKLRECKWQWQKLLKQEIRKISHKPNVIQNHYPHLMKYLRNNHNDDIDKINHHSHQIRHRILHEQLQLVQGLSSLKTRTPFFSLPFLSPLSEFYYDFFDNSLDPEPPFIPQFNYDFDNDPFKKSFFQTKRRKSTPFYQLKKQAELEQKHFEGKGTKCSSCGLFGHMKSNKYCPKYQEARQQEDLLLYSEAENKGLLRKDLTEPKLIFNVNKVKAEERERSHREKKRKYEMIKEELKISKKNTNIGRRSGDPRVNLSRIFEEVIESMKNIDEQKFFRQPVTISKYPSYKIISHPMDLHTLKTQAENKYYLDHLSFLHDIQLIHTNSEIFNGKNHFITQQAKKVVNEGLNTLLRYESQIATFEREIYVIDIIECILSALENHPVSVHFRYNPLNRLASYHRIIATPLSLSHIRTHLKRYTNFSHFLADIYWIKENSIIYNGLEHFVTTESLKLFDLTCVLCSEYMDLQNVQQEMTPIIQQYTFKQKNFKSKDKSKSHK